MTLHLKSPQKGDFTAAHHDPHLRTPRRVDYANVTATVNEVSVRFSYVDVEPWPGGFSFSGSEQLVDSQFTAIKTGEHDDRYPLVN